MLWTKRDHNKTGQPSRWQGLPLGILLGLAFLLLTAGRSSIDLFSTVRSDRVLVALIHSGTASTVVVGQIVFHVAVLLTLHALLGLLAFAMARLTERGCGPIAGRRALVSGWFCLIGAWILLTNIQLYPSTTHSSPGTWLRADWHGVNAANSLGAAILALIGSVLWRLRGTVRNLQSLRRAAVPVGATALAAVLATYGFHTPESRAAANPAHPNVILLGIDSLRADVAINSGGFVETPNISAFLQDAKILTNTTTPLARTFPSWMSILTGQHPVSTNARFNLMPRREVHDGNTIGDLLRARGYRTIYATDEVRFANIDASYGFDQTVTPRVGITDFLLGNANDLPLPNLLSSLPISRWLFPSTYANRAAWVTYKPASFLHRLDTEIQPAGPTFLAIHLTLAHWPYYYGGVEKPVFSPSWREMYGLAVPAVDRQFADVMAMLRRKGLLDNAIVVVLSDHGEALGKRSDSIMGRFGTPDEIGHSMWGHGTSVLSPNQFQVLFAFRGFGAAGLQGPARIDAPASLEDLKPTVMDLLGARPAEIGPVDGRSLRGILEGGAPGPEVVDRIRYTETDVNTPKLLAGQIDEKGLIREAASFYEIEPSRGWAQLRRDKLRIILDRKERAAMQGDFLLAAIPSETKTGQFEYVFLDRRLPVPMRFRTRPDEARLPEAAHLWDALHARFHGELGG